jgi:hypothetical protein
MLPTPPHHPTYIHTYTHTHIHTYIHTYTHTHTHIHTHTHTHTHIHTYTQVRAVAVFQYLGAPFNEIGEWIFEAIRPASPREVSFSGMYMHIQHTIIDTIIHHILHLHTYRHTTPINTVSNTHTLRVRTYGGLLRDAGPQRYVTCITIIDTIIMYLHTNNAY